MAGAKARFHGMVPCFCNAWCKPAGIPGTPNDCQPNVCFSKFALPSSMNMPGLDASGACVLKSNELIFFPPSSETIKCPPYPPNPHICGEVIAAVAAAVMIASTALPPSLKIFAPSSSAKGSPTTPSFTPDLFCAGAKEEAKKRSPWLRWICACLSSSCSYTFWDWRQSLQSCSGNLHNATKMNDGFEARNHKL